MIKTYKFSPFTLLVVAFLCNNLAFAQIVTDTLSQDIIENVYKEVPNTVKNDSIKRTSFSAYPYVFYSPESQFAGGAGGIYIFYAGQEKDLKPSKIGFGGYYSTNKQYKLSVSPVLYLFDNNLYIEAPTSFGFFINKYWGIGDDVPDYDNASYSIQTFTTTVKVQIPPLLLFSADRTGLIFDFDQTDIVDKLGNEKLEDETLPGNNGGTIMGIGTDLTWDSRDNLFFPNSGIYQYFKTVIYPGGISDFNFALFELDVKSFLAIAPDHVFAFNMYVQSVVGDTPFYKLPALGGSKRMRGFFNGRYRDNFYGMLQAEYRQYFYRKWGFVAFAGAGNVSNTIVEYDFSSMKYSYGVGLRFLFNKQQKINLRMDIGFGSDGSRGIYFGIQEAF
ncbi:BamA/TamA family outer membrane protein [Lutimonas sp.]|uniref:BamA/TamA family outer membrane protein n=1 Tax=Lutimonas sp. TaxID=1872403 RepID=UPI003C77C640